MKIPTEGPFRYAGTQITFCYDGIIVIQLIYYAISLFQVFPVFRGNAGFCTGIFCTIIVLFLDAESIDMKSVSVSEQNRTSQVLHKSANKENDVGMLNFDIEKDSDLTLDSITKTMTECVLKDSEKSQGFVMKKNADEFKFNFTEPEIKNDCV